MTQPHKHQLQDLFEQALDQPPVRRRAFLDEACGVDGRLRVEIEQLLCAHDDAGSHFLGVSDSRFVGSPQFKERDVLSGRYSIRSLAGSGGMSSVYKADDLQLGGVIALKVMSAAGTEPLSRFRQEIQLARQITHPNVYRVFDVGVHEGNVYYTMEFLDGETLAYRLRRGALGCDEALSMLGQVAAGLQAAHARGTVHRDLKPSNIMLVPEGNAHRAIILDFGIAKQMLATDALTSTGLMMGSLWYMAPEQKGGGPVSAATDIYALGLIAIEAVSGATPPDISALSKLPQHWRGPIQRALERDPSRRYSSAAAFLNAIKGRTNLRRRTAFALTLAAAVVGVIGFWMSGSGEFQTRSRQGQPWELYLEGRKLLDQHYRPGNLEGATERLRAAVAQDPKSALAWAALAEASRLRYASTQDSRFASESIEYCRKALQIAPGLASAYVTLGSLHSSAGENQLAVQELERARELDPRSPEPLAALGRSYENLGRQKEAEQVLRAAVTIRPDSWDTLNRLGAFYARERRYTESREQFESVLRLSPDNAEACANLAVVEKNLNNIPRAEALLKRSIQLKPSYAAYVNLGNIYFARQQTPNAIGIYEKALQINTLDYRIWGNLAWALRRAGTNPARARQALNEAALRAEKLTSAQRTNGLAHADLAMFYAALGRVTEAKRYLGAATQMDPENPAIHIKAAEALEMVGLPLQAGEQLRVAVGQGSPVPDDPALRKVAQMAGLFQK